MEQNPSDYQPGHISESLEEAASTLQDMPAPHTPDELEARDIQETVSDLEAEKKDIERLIDSGDATPEDMRRLDDIKIDINFARSQSHGIQPSGD